ncbi:MAG: TolC family protein [Acidobacteriota bacterium]|nr:TolC family protein [Acidobacteriota bacterium]
MHVRQFLSSLLILALAATPLSAQQLSGGASQLNVPQSLDQLLAAGQQSPFSGSVPEGKLVPGVIDISVEDAITRGLRYNLGVVLSSQTTEQAKAQRLKELSNLLPHLDGSLRETEIKENLLAEGFNLGANGAAFGINGNSVRFSNSDARISMSEDLFDWHAIQGARAAQANVKAANFSFGTARETVTLAVAASYLLVVSAESQVDAAQAELKTAEALFQLAEDREKAGLSPDIDTLRARVELQVRRQNLIEANNNLAKQRITLLRVLGLPVHQQFRLSSRVPYRPLPLLGEEDALKHALAARPDYLAAEQQVKSAELQRQSALAERYPTLGISGDYGTLGTHPSNVFPTWSVNAGVKIPIFEGGKTEADIKQADSVLKQRRAQRDDLRGRIEQDVASAFLDVNSAAEQVEVARVTVDYAQQALTQSQDRFSAGVTNNIEVIQAQEAMATANEQYIGSLYAHNIAKVLLARAMGAAEQTLRQVLGDAASPGQAPAQAQPAPVK